VSEAEKQSNQKSTFFASMSHEFRTPLNAIIGFAELIRDKQLGEDPKLYNEYGRIITNSGKMMQSLVDDLLDFAGIEAGQLELDSQKIEIAELIEKTTGMMTQMAVDAGVSLNVNLPGELPPIYADRRSLEQILLNLLSNAIKFTPEGGAVSVAAEWRDRGLDTESAILVVSDTGIGMAQPLIDQVFDPYEQDNTSGDGRARGIGLGLPICKRLVAAHDGRIEITSTVREGTTVTFALPTLSASRKRTERGHNLQRYVSTPTDVSEPVDSQAA
jgi:signal transduction histidine kinase